MPASLRRNAARTPSYSVIIPAHNEEARIARTLLDYAGAFPDGEVIVVANACSDDTAKTARRCGVSNVRVLEIDKPIGKGGAVREGFSVASAPLVGYADADGATSGTEFRRLFSLLGSCDAVIGSRWLPGARLCPPQPLSRRVASRSFNLCVRAMTGLRYTDTQCGAKVFRADALRPALATIETANFAFDVDLLVELRRRGKRIVEEPICWNDSAGSHIKLLPAAARMFAAVLRLTMKRNLLRRFVPVFDRLFPTQPLPPSSVTSPDR